MPLIKFFKTILSPPQTPSRPDNMEAISEHTSEGSNGEVDSETIDTGEGQAGHSADEAENGHDTHGASSWPQRKKVPGAPITPSDKEWRSHPQVRGLLAKWAFLLEHNLFTDFTFIVGTSKEPLRCHTLVLKMQSKYFEYTFDKREMTEMEVPNCEPKVFRKFLKYLYTDQMEFTADDATDGLMLAKQFLIPILPLHLEKIVLEGICCENAASLLQKAEEMHHKHMVVKVQEFILRNASQVVFRPSFTEISLISLIKLLEASRTFWKMKEVTILDVVKNWAVADCARKTLEPTGPNQYLVAKRAFDLIQYIQFTPMQFTSEVVKPKLLPPEKLLEIQSKLIENESKGRNNPFSSANDEDLKFLEFDNRRARSSSPEPAHLTDNETKIQYDKIFTLSRYSSVNPKDWIPDNGIYKISLQVSRPIILVGFALYGQSDGGATVQNVTIVITNYEEDSAIAEFTKEMKVTEGGGESEVFFPHPVPLDALEWYTFAVSTPGRVYPTGIGGKRQYTMEIDHAPVSFNFKNSEGVTGASHVRGQLPKIFFSVPLVAGHAQ